jgi:hypothetical protein
MGKRQRWLGLGLVLVVGIPTSALPATLQVSNTGTDGPGCGGTSPCRSIGQAVANAAAGDKIVVGPGLYSDNLDGDLGVSAPGEEPRGGITITKPLQIVSELGASSTLVNSFGPVFLVESSGVTLGVLGSGFTIETLGNPVLISGNSQLVNVRVGGNVIVIDDPRGPAGIAALNTRGRIEHNRIVAPGGCSFGIFLAQSADLVTRNVVLGCATGIFAQDSEGVRFVQNTVIGSGFNVPGGFGFDLNRGTVAEFSNNAVIGNGTGVLLGMDIPTFRGNTLAGSSTNCGVSNFSGTTLHAANNFWGAATGPGDDPADTVCNSEGSSAVTTPFLTADPTRAQAAIR